MKRFHWRLLLLFAAALPGFAGTITYSCDGSLNTAECGLLTTVAGQYSDVFTNSSAKIDVLAGNANGNVAENTQIYNSVSYSNYYNKLKTVESGANDVTAVNSLGTCNGGCSDPVIGSSNILLTGPLESALGLGTPTGICFLIVNGSTNSICTNNVGSATYGSCGLTNANCYNDILTVSSSLISTAPDGSHYDFVTAVEHETDEALGTPSCLANTTGTPFNGCSSTQGGVTTFFVSAGDLFRYSAANTRSFLGVGGNQANGSLAYFSINKGLTEIVPYNNSTNGADYGDFSTLLSCGTYVQDADGCPGQTGLTIENDGAVEIALLDAVGYTLTTRGQQLDGQIAPEPSSVVMALAGIGAIGLIARRRMQARG